MVIRTHWRTGTDTNLPSVPVVKPKVKKQDPGLNIPPGLDLRTIRDAENIPTKYIKAHFVLEDHRESKTKMIEGFPLFRTIIEQALGVQLYNSINTPGRDSYGDEVDDLRQATLNGSPVKMERVLDVLKNILASDATLSLFKTAKIYCHAHEEYKRIPEIGGLVPMEIVLCKEEVIHETDTQVITKLKKKVFAEISRYRRAKSRY